MKIILASASPRRKQLLEEAGYDVFCAPSGIEEIHDESLTPQALALENASRKARAVARLFPDDLVVAADTVVALEGRFFGKPSHFEEAAWMLRQLSNRTHQVVTGVVIIASGECPIFFSELSLVTFLPLEESTIRSYLRSIDPLDKAGAYAAQGDNNSVIQHIVGSLTNVIGLPMERLTEVLRRRT